VVGIGFGSRPPVRGREFAIADTKSTNAARSPHGPSRGNHDFKLYIWLVDSAYLAMENRRHPNASAPGDEPLKR